MKRNPCRATGPRSASPSVPAILAFATLLAAANLARAGDISYTMDNYAGQNGTVLSGTVTTDGTIGTLALSNIVTYDITITPANAPTDPAFTITPATINPTTNDPYSLRVNNLQASLTDLYLAPAIFTYFTVTDPFIVLDYEDYYSVPAQDDSFTANDVAGNQLFTQYPGEYAGGIGIDPMTIATVVPEPATLTLLASALLGLGAVRLRRRA